MKFSAIIPVRAGSRRLPNKNILPFADSNLLVHKINQLKKVKKIDEIVVSSDSDVMLEMALKENVKIHRRSIEYSAEVTKSFGEVVALLAAEVVAFDDLMACGTMAAAKEKGLVRSEGKDYVMNDGDIVLFRFNV